MEDDDVFGVAALLLELLVFKAECGVDCDDKCNPIQLDVFWFWVVDGVGVIVNVAFAGVIVIKLLTECRWYEWCNYFDVNINIHN